MHTVAVDAGHGLKTPGKQSPNGTKENEFNHACKQYLIVELKRNGFLVADCNPTRDDNSLRDRCDRANKVGADLFVSIHYNAMGDVWQTKARGIETYHAIGSRNGKRFADLVQKQLLQGTAATDRGVKGANFFVLRHTIMPAILVECGFMDNPTDYQLMLSKEYQKECAVEICKGICQYLGKPYVNEVNVKAALDDIIDQLKHLRGIL